MSPSLTSLPHRPLTLPNADFNLGFYNEVQDLVDVEDVSMGGCNLLVKGGGGSKAAG